jgi:hypothetical protein
LSSAPADRQFALNVGAAFHTPEALFLGHAEAPFDVGFDPRAFVRDREAAQSGAVAVAPSPQVRSEVFETTFEV